MPPEVVLLLVLCELPFELLLLVVLELCELLPEEVFELCEPVLVVLELDVVLLVEPLLSDEPLGFKSLLALFSAAAEDE